MTSAELSEFPGIIGYIAANEESLWDIAKRYKSTVEELQRINKMTTDRVKKGDKVLITR
jgi:LysM repeat protein